MVAVKRQIALVSNHSESMGRDKNPSEITTNLRIETSAITTRSSLFLGRHDCAKPMQFFEILSHCLPKFGMIRNKFVCAHAI